MNWLQRAVSAIEKRAIVILGQHPRDHSITDWLLGPPTRAGVEITADTALTLSAVWQAVTAIAGSLACLPICLKEEKPDGTFEEIREDPALAIICDEPNPYCTPAIFREALQAHTLISGNGYAEIERDNGGRPLAFWPINPARVSPQLRKDGEVIYEVTQPGGMPNEYIKSENMLHIPGLGWDGTQGYGVFRMARESWALGLAAERYGGTYFGQGAQPGGVLETEKKLSNEAKNTLRTDWNEMHQGPDRAHRIAILMEGLKWKGIVSNPADAQFLETRKFQIEEVARWFNIPPHMLRSMDRATHSNIEFQGREFVQYTLHLWMVKWEQELKRKLLGARSSRCFHFDADALMRGVMLDRFKAWQVSILSGWNSPDDVRRKEGDNPIRDGAGDVYLIPVNMTTKDKMEASDGSANGGEPGTPGGGGQAKAGGDGGAV